MSLDTKVSTLCYIQYCLPSVHTQNTVSSPLIRFIISFIYIYNLQFLHAALDYDYMILCAVIHLHNILTKMHVNVDNYCTNAL